LVAIAFETRCWRQRPQSEEKTYKDKPAARVKRGVVDARPAADTVAAVAARLPASSWYQRTVSAGTKGPIEEALARQGVTRCQEGLPERTVWLVIKRTVGATPEYAYEMSHAPVSTPWRLLVWRSGVRWAMEQCWEESQTALGRAPYELRTSPGWPPHMLMTMWAHFFSGPCRGAWGKTAPALTVSQLRTLLAGGLPWRRETIDDGLGLVAWVQRRNHQAYRAHRKRRQEGGECQRRTGGLLRKQFLSYQIECMLSISSAKVS
jgi:hypothetical protein